MSLFKRAVLTRLGKNLITKAHKNHMGIKITHAETGDGTWDDEEDLEQAAHLKNQKQSFGITSIEIPYEGESYVDINLVINNVGLEELYYLRELGVYAEDPDEGEILYAIAISGEEPVYIPEDNGVGISVISERIVIEVANASNVTIDRTGALVSASLFEQYRSVLDAIDGRISEGNAGDVLIKKTGDRYGFGWVNLIYVGSRDKFPKTGYKNGVYIDPTRSAVYVWNGDDYDQLALGAEAAEVLQEQISKNKNDIVSIKKKFDETQIFVPEESWVQKESNGITVYEQTIKVNGMTKDTEADVIPGAISKSAEDLIKEQDALSLFLSRGTADSVDGGVLLRCYKKKPAVEFGLILRGFKEEANEA